jgi:excisionase family DNA binding protein
MRADLEPRFLKPGAVAGILSVTESQVLAMLRRGELPGVKLGGRGVWRVERAKLEEYIAGRYEQTARATSPHPLTEAGGDARPGSQDA